MKSVKFFALLFSFIESVATFYFFIPFFKKIGLQPFESCMFICGVALMYYTLSFTMIMVWEIYDKLECFKNKS